MKKGNEPIRAICPRCLSGYAFHPSVIAKRGKVLKFFCVCGELVAIRKKSPLLMEKVRQWDESRAAATPEQQTPSKWILFFSRKSVKQTGFDVPDVTGCMTKQQAIERAKNFIRWYRRWAEETARDLEQDVERYEFPEENKG